MLAESSTIIANDDLYPIVTAIGCCILTTYTILPWSLNLLNLPPIQVIFRTIRKAIFFLPAQLVLVAWLFRRAFISTKWTAYNIKNANDDDDDAVESILSAVIHQVLIPIEHVLQDQFHQQTYYYSTSLSVAKGAVFLCSDALGLFLLYAVASSLWSLYRTSWKEFKGQIMSAMVDFLSELPFVRREIEKEERKMMADLESSLKDPNRKVTRTLPEHGTEANVLIADLQKRGKAEDMKWENGMVSGTVYCGESSHTDLLNAAYAAFSLSNPLHTDIWPSVNQFEAEVCAMTASFLNGGNADVVGCISSGGTESIVLAAKAHRDYFGRRNGIRKPEIVSCYTAHAGIDKACDMLDIRNVKVNFDPKTFEVDVDAMERAINADTIMIYASAPNFPQGVIDPIEKLSNLAVKYGVGLHVDCCLGGFVLPFGRRMGYDIPCFDFSIVGVTSISCDTHKYGYASKGTSVILYRNKDLRRAQYFAYPEWTGGLYSTPTIAGSRPGALLACAWASMMSMGEDGYRERAKVILDTTQSLAKQVASIPGLRLLGEPKSMIVCFGSDDFNIYRVGDAMAHKGWSLNSLQRPACIHLCVTIPVAKHADRFVQDLKEVVQKILAENGGANKKEGGTAAMYGKAGSLPAGPISELLKSYTDCMLTP
mmetsp:Transcript_28439/g.44221  ORF Transcript_28439/g.44221 Transcript_28439/m.44221 type:complete len:653 (-) Transcript_28439:136-2094(-)